MTAIPSRLFQQRNSPLAPSLPAVGLFARSPIPGKSKTRLIPLLGAAGAARFQAALASDAARKVNGLAGIAARYYFLAGSPSNLPRLRGWTLLRQRGRDLGEKLERAFACLLRVHPAAVIIGTDSPELPSRLLRQALSELRASDAVIGPAPDGGYYLIGLRRFKSRLLRGVRWGTRFAYRDTLGRLLDSSFVCSILETCPDVDRPDDFGRLAKTLRARLAPASRRFVKEWCEEQRNPATRARAKSSRRRGPRRRRKKRRDGRVDHAVWSP